MNVRIQLRTVLFLATVTATPVCPAIVQTAISVLQEKAEKEVDRVIEKEADKLREKLEKLDKVTDKAMDAVTEVVASVDDVREDIEEVRTRVEEVKSALQKAVSAATAAERVLTAAEEVPKYIQALMDNEGGGYATYVNTVVANSGAYVQSAAQTAAHVNSGLNDLLKKLEEAKAAAVKNKIGHANTTPFDPDEAKDEEQMTDHEKLMTDQKKAEYDQIKDEIGDQTEEDLEKKRQEQEKEFAKKSKEDEAELQKEQEAADAARKKEDGTVDMSAWTRTREDGTVTTKTRLEEQKEEAAADKISGVEDVSGSGDSFNDGEEVPQWVLDQASKE